MSDHDSDAGAAERRAAGNPYVALLLAWLVPGAGHFYLGRRARALTFLALVLGSLAIGLSLEGDLYRDLPTQPIISRLWTLGAMGIGLPYFLLRYVAAYQGTVTGPASEYGSAFVLTAGLMNLLLVLDAWDIARGRKE